MTDRIFVPTKMTYDSTCPICDKQLHVGDHAVTYKKNTPARLMGLVFCYECFCQADSSRKMEEVHKFFRRLKRLEQIKNDNRTK